MTDRLIHSSSGYLRSMQMTSARLLAFVEGEEFDRYFYSGICQTITANYQIRRVQEVPNFDGKNKSAAGGKKALISFFEHLKQKSKLFINDNEQKQISIFFLDKDVDDILGKIIISPHIIYTKYYCIENHIIAHGDLNKAATIIASYDMQYQIIGNNIQWRQEVAKRWKEWVILCIFSIKYQLSCECTYKTLPNRNKPLYTSLSKDIYLFYENIVKEAIYSQMTEEDFKNALDHIREKVNELYATGKHDFVFKGKWYAGFLEATIELVETKQSSKSSHKSYFQTIIATLNFNDEWVDDFKNPIKQLFSKLQ